MSNNPQTLVPQLYPEATPDLIGQTLVDLAAQKGLKLHLGSHFFGIHKGNKVLRIAINHFAYLGDMINNFENMHDDSIEPIFVDGNYVVDMSMPRWHEIKGFSLFPVYCPMGGDTVETIRQYIDFARVGKGSVVLDLGAYSGLTSIMFAEVVGSSGRVISVEADRKNIEGCKKNFAVYKNVRGQTIELIEAAVWKDGSGVDFGTEGTMGSFVAESGRSRGDVRRTPSITLAQIAGKFDLDRIDFIKCDIEGAETSIFDQPEFFAKFSPRIMIEAHMTGAGQTTARQCSETLARYGYATQLVNQNKFCSLPLLACERGA